MPKQEEDQIFQFILTLISVKMKVKFPCKMTLQQTGRTLASEVYSNEEGRFTFNQEIRLREQSQKLFTQLNICLVTEKGARYISGIAKLYHSELLRSEGERLVVSLSKCLDTQSFCEIRVEKVIRENPVRTRTLTTIPERNQKYTSPRHNEEMNQLPTDFKSPKKIQTPQIGFQSKSESHFPVTGNLRIGTRQYEHRGRDYNAMAGVANYYRKNNHSPKDRSRPMNSKNKYQPLEFNADFQRQKVLQAQVYKDNYQKLKQKYLKQVQTSKNELNKRIMLENNENNYKLQIVKLRLKTQELQKSLVDKNVKLKELAITISALQGRQSELNILKEDLANKQHAIDIMDDTIITLSKQNDELRLASKQNLYKLQEKILIIQNELEMSQTKSIAKQQQLQRQIKNLHQMLQHKQGQILRKTEMLEKQKKNGYELQRSLQNKLFQYDSQLHNERNLCKQKIDQTKLKIQEANQNSLKLTLEKSELSSQIDKLKGLLLKNQYQFKLYQQQINNLKAQIQQLKPIRDKYNEMIKQLRSISEQKIILQRNHQKIIVSKETTIQSVTQQYKKQIQSLKKTIKELQDKSKSLSIKFIQSDSQLQISKNGLQKFKRNNQTLTKELAQLKQKQKTQKKNLKSKQEQLEDTKKELIRLKEKNQSLFENTKNEVSKNRDDLSRLKIQLQAQIGKNQQLVQTNSQLNMQLARMKMSQQFAEEKYEKLTQSAQQKYAQFEKIMKEHQNVIELFEQKIRVQKSNQKDLIGRLQKCDNQLGIAFEKNEKLIKEQRISEQKLKQYDNALKSKQTQLIQTLKRVSDLQIKIQTLQQEKRQIKDHLQFNHNEFQKSKKIVQILQKDYQNAKGDIISYCQKLNQRQKQLDDKIAESKRQKDNYSASETKYNSLKKQYQKFKDSISQALSSSFTQAIQSFSSDKYQAVKTSNINDSTIYSFRRGIMDLNNDLINAINSAGKQNKTQIQKLNQINRILERDIDLLKNQIERIQQLHRKQINQKSRELSELEQELRLIKTQKGEVQVQNHLTIEQFEEQINQYKSECESLMLTKDQLQFSLGSLRLQIQRMNQDYSKKIYFLTNQKNQLQQKLQYQFHNTEVAQKRVHDLEIELMNLNSLLILEKQQIYKKQLLFAESEHEKQKIIKDLQTVKKQLKEVQEKFSQLDIQFTTIRQIKEQYQIKLNEQENKLKEVRMFNKNILNQKQQIIKKQLQKNLQATQLQNMIVDLRHSLQSEEQLKRKYKSDLQETTEIAKKYLNQVKDLQYIFAQQKTKYNQILSKLRQKEQNFKDIKEQSVSLKNRLEDCLKRGKMTAEQLDIQNNRLHKQLQCVKIESHQKISNLQSQLSKVNLQLSVYKQEISEVEQALFVQRENNNSMHECINKLKQEIEEFRNKLQEIEKAHEELAIQNKEKDQNMFEMGGKIYQYETRMREMEEQKMREIEQLNNNLSVKYDQDYQQINQKIQFIQKQKEYFKQKYHEKQLEISKKNQEMKHIQIQQIQFKKMYEQKIKKLEQQKLSIFTDKNKQITKALQENKAQFQNIRLKEAELRKILHQLQISRNTIQKLQAKLKQMQNQKQNHIKTYQTEIENLRKKDFTFKNYKDTVKSNQWNCQRQVRKQIQTFIKKWLQGGQKQLRSENLITSIKSMQQGLLGAISVMGIGVQ